MARITCEIAKDLLPLYVDGVLSDDSKKMVGEHLETCKECSDCLQALSSTDAGTAVKKHADEKAALKKIRRRINLKRLRTAIITALCIAAVVIGLFYGIVIREHYIPYEESGLYVSGDKLCSDRDYYSSYGVYSPDGESEFIYMTTTAYTDMRNRERACIVEDLSEAGRTMQIQEDDQTTARTLVCKAIYYVPETTAKQFMKGDYWTNAGTDEGNQKEAEELKAASVLLWKAE